MTIKSKHNLLMMPLFRHTAIEKKQQIILFNNDEIVKDEDVEDKIPTIKNIQLGNKFLLQTSTISKSCPSNIS